MSDQGMKINQILNLTLLFIWFPGLRASNFPFPSLPVAFSNSHSLPVKRVWDFQFPFPFPGSKKTFPLTPALATLHDHHPIQLQNRPYLPYKTFLEPFPYLNAQLQILLKRKHCQSKVNACQSICIEGSQLEETKHQIEQIMLQRKKYAALIGLHLGFYKN